MKIGFLSSATTIIVVMGNFLFPTVTAQNKVDVKLYEDEICACVEIFVMKCYPLYFDLSIEEDNEAVEDAYEDFTTFTDGEFDQDDIGAEGEITALFNDYIYSGAVKISFFDEAEDVLECLFDAMLPMHEWWVKYAASDGSLSTSGKRWASRKLKSAKRHARRENYRKAIRRLMQIMLVVEVGVNEDEKVLDPNCNNFFGN